MQSAAHELKKKRCGTKEKEEYSNDMHFRWLGLQIRGESTSTVTRSMSEAHQQFVNLVSGFQRFLGFEKPENQKPGNLERVPKSFRKISKKLLAIVGWLFFWSISNSCLIIQVSIEKHYYYYIVVGSGVAD